jgi:hypothetical protein
MFFGSDEKCRFFDKEIIKIVGEVKYDDMHSESFNNVKKRDANQNISIFNGYTIYYKGTDGYCKRLGKYGIYKDEDQVAIDGHENTPYQWGFRQVNDLKEKITPLKSINGNVEYFFRLNGLSRSVRGISSIPSIFIGSANSPSDSTAGGKRKSKKSRRQRRKTRRSRK